MEFSAQQEQALNIVAAWLRDRTAPFLYLAGFGGSGKTTLARHFAENAGKVLFASFTGKAASVMRSKGCPDATTIHQLIYTPNDQRDRKKLKELVVALKSAKTEAEAAGIRREIHAEKERLRQPSFKLNLDSEVRKANLVIIDECSMVGNRMGHDLLSFGTPILVLGDPAQLPPVRSTGFFTNGTPDFMLTEVHRQAAESGILRLATLIREGGELTIGDYGEAAVIDKADLDPTDVPTFDQVLVGKNVTRRRTNNRVRELLGIDARYPTAGDKLVCLRNNHDLGLLNGETWRATEIVDKTGDVLELEIENDSGDELLVYCWTYPFDGEDIPHYEHTPEVQEFDYGYALTVHKSQGSQYGSVMVYDQSRCFGVDARRWLYTAITRASERLVVVK